MRLHEQATAQRELLNTVEEDVRSLIGSLARKMQAPFGDGSRSNLVNGEQIVSELHVLINKLADRP